MPNRPALKRDGRRNAARSNSLRRDYFFFFAVFFTAFFAGFFTAFFAAFFLAAMSHFSVDERCADRSASDGIEHLNDSMCEFLLINKEKINSLYLTYSRPMSAQIKLWRFRALFLVVLGGISGAAHAQTNSPQTLQFTVFHTLEHDRTHFTQGLAIHGGKIFEGTGLHGFSALYEKDLKTGKTLKTRKLAQNIFGEGVTLLNDRIYQLSWLNRTGFVYDLAFKPLREFHYDTEGWGLTNDGSQLIMSDGSAQLYWLDEKNLQVTRQVTVHDGSRAIPRLNELEYAEGLIYANVWLTDRIAVIEPDSGNVRAWLDLSALKKGFIKPPGWNEAEHVLNGIAYDPRTQHFFVTGKCWPAIFELVLEKQ